MEEVDPATKQFADALSYWTGRVRQHSLIERDYKAYAEQVVTRLRSSDRRLAADAALTVSEWEPWTDHGRAGIPADWRGTPLGRLTLLASSHTSEEMSVPEAMAMRSDIELPSRREQRWPRS